MVLIKLTIELVKLVYKIIEGLIKALLTILMQGAWYCAGVIGIILTGLIIRYGVCDVESCFNSQTATNFTVFAFCALTLFATCVAIKRFAA